MHLLQKVELYGIQKLANLRKSLYSLKKTIKYLSEHSLKKIKIIFLKKIHQYIQTVVISYFFKDSKKKKICIVFCLLFLLFYFLFVVVLQYFYAAALPPLFVLVAVAALLPEFDTVEPAPAVTTDEL